MTELVSVVIPTRNRCVRLLDAISSVREQTDVNLEIIVVDDASSDDTQRSLLALCNDEPRLRYVRNERPLGGSGARNAGGSLAKGNFIAFLDDDDRFLPGKLARQLTLLRERPDASAASCSFWISSGSRKLVLRLIYPPHNRDGLLSANMLGGASVCMVRTSSFLAIGGFDPGLPSCQDWDLWLKLHALGPIVVCDEPLVRYNFHAEGQITGNATAEYRGRRRVHLRYLNEMSPALRRSSIASLIYYRRVRFGMSAMRSIAGVWTVINLVRGYERASYFWRALRLFSRRCIAQAGK